MGSIPFVKMQAVGNDFVLVDARKTGERDWSRLVERMGHRPFGIGSDGLLVVEPGKRSAVRMRMWNPDGTEDFCGNGLRCAARYAFEHHLVNQTAFEIETISGEVKVGLTVVGELNEPKEEVEVITLDLGMPRFEPSKVPIRVEPSIDPVLDYPLRVNDRTFEITSLSTGTTHTVIFTPSTPDDVEFFAYSPLIEHHPLFPERTNALWVTVESPGRISMRIWERGVGETFGCGSGACAAAIAAKLHDWTEDCVEVQSKGGSVKVDYRPGESVRLTGDAQVVFEGVYFE